jgi:hypothetical protein
LIESAQQDMLFVDGYMGADFVSRYLPHVPQGVTVRLLTKNMVPQLASALGAYVITARNGPLIEASGI